MPKAMKKSSPEQSAPPSEEHESIDTQAEMSSSGQESDPEVFFALLYHHILPPQCSYLILKDPK